jgi:hypothetical protein
MNPWAIVGGLVIAAVLAGAGLLEGHRIGQNEQAVKDNATIANLERTISTMQNDANEAALKHNAAVAAAEQGTQKQLEIQAENLLKEAADEKAKDDADKARLRAGTDRLRVALASGSCAASGGSVPGAAAAAGQPDGAGSPALDGAVAAHLESYAVSDFNAVARQIKGLQDYALQAQALCNGKPN